MNLDYIVENYRGEGLVATKEKVYDADEAARNESSHGKNTMKPVVEKYERIFKAIKDMLVNAGFKEGSAGYYSAFDYVLSKKAGVKLDSLNLKRFSNSEPRRASQAGRTARNLAAFRGPNPVLAICYNERLQRL